MFKKLFKNKLKDTDEKKSYSEEKNIKENKEDKKDEKHINEVIENKKDETKNNELRVNIFGNLKEKLSKSREGLFGNIKKVFSEKKVIDEEMYEELEEILIQSDIGFEMTEKIVENLEKEIKDRKIKEISKVYSVLENVLEGFLIHGDNEVVIREGKLNVVLIVGVNGVGKTTTIGKMSQQFRARGHKVIIGAADTFRAAAIEQLEEWANRAKVDIIKHNQGADPGAVVYDTLKAAKNRDADIAIIDTAGRLHNKSNLMNELSKINKIIKKEIGENEFYESILVIDGTTGQNGFNQAKVFSEVTDLSGFIITKLDGTAKGGIIFTVSELLKKPVKYIGVGEGINDLQEFNPKKFIKAIFED